MSPKLDSPIGAKVVMAEPLPVDGASRHFDVIRHCPAPMRGQFTLTRRTRHGPTSPAGAWAYVGVSF